MANTVASFGANSAATNILKFKSATGGASSATADMQDIFICIGLAAEMACSETPLKSLDLLNDVKKFIGYEMFESFLHIRDAIAMAARHTHSSINISQKKLRSNATVYIVQNTSGKIKIGYSKDVAARMKQLSIGSHDDLVLLATTTGGSKKEAMLHKKFKKDRVSNEWFNPSGELMAFIASINEKEE